MFKTMKLNFRLCTINNSEHIGLYSNYGRPVQQMRTLYFVCNVSATRLKAKNSSQEYYNAEEWHPTLLWPRTHGRPSQLLLSSCMVSKISAKLKRSHPNEGAKCRWGRLKLAAFDSKPSTVASVVISVRSQVYHTERPPLFAARLL